MADDDLLGPAVAKTPAVRPAPPVGPAIRGATRVLDPPFMDRIEQDGHRRHQGTKTTGTIPDVVSCNEVTRAWRWAKDRPPALTPQ